MNDHDRAHQSTRLGPLPRIAAALGVGTMVALAGPVAGIAMSPDALPRATAEAPQAFQGRVWDAADVLTDAQEASLNERLAQLQQDNSTVLRIVFVDSFDGVQPEAWAQRTWQALGGTPNLAVFAVAVGDRNAGAFAGNGVNKSGQDIAAAAGSALASDDWYGAAGAAIEEASPASAAESAGVIGAGVAGAAAIGGGALAWSRRSRRKRTASEVEDGRTLRPDDVASHDRLSTDALDELAREELVSTDESIRLAATELELARAEFGDARVRDLGQALVHSRRTLDRAFEIRHRLDAGPAPAEGDRRSMLLEIISTCGTADDRLDGEVARYSGMREQLLNAPETLDHMTQRAIDLRTRIPQAKTVLDGLRARYNEDTLASITDNIDMATEHVSMAERSADDARALLSKPAGEQSGLVDALRATDLALDQADKLVEGIEHADDNIAQAVAGLGALVEEVRDEIGEANNLLAAPDAAKINREGLAAAVAAGTEALRAADATGAADPLGAWTTLNDADADLDEQLADARDAADAFSRTMQTLHNSLSDARAQVTAARDIIGTRRSIVGSTARTRLAEAERHLSIAETIANHPGDSAADYPRRGIQEARTAAQLGRDAARAARDDINRHRQRNSYGGGGNSGAMVAGIVLGSMMNGGGGFGGGFGGGGGGFGGGSGGSGGSISF